MYKKYPLFILYAFFSLHALSALWLFTGYYHPKKESVWINSIYEKKEAIAQSIQGPKIVIVSGSFGLFGVRAARLESHFQVPVVNMGTHGALRDYYLERAKKNIKPGDLVILAPEYEQYFYNLAMNEIKSDFIVNYDKTTLKNLPWDEKRDVLVSSAHPWKLLKTVIKDIRSNKSGNEERGYNARNLNANGDDTSNFGTKNLCIEPLPMSREFDPNAYGVRKIRDFLDWCQDEKVAVIVAWPGTLAFQKTSQGAEIRFINSLIALLSNEGVEVLGKPEDFFVPEEYMFDTINHLNSEGASRHTSQLIGFLEKSPTFASWVQNHAGTFEPVEAGSDASKMKDVCANGGVEKSANRKPLGWRPVIEKKGGGVALWDNSAAHGGNYSLKLVNTSSGKVRWMGEKIELPPGIHMIHAGGWSKAEDVEAPARYCINLKTFFRDGSFQWNVRELIFPAGTHDWVPVRTVLTYDAEIMAVQPFLMLHEGKGTVWFDDIFIQIPEEGATGQ